MAQKLPITAIRKFDSQDQMQSSQPVVVEAMENKTFPIATTRKPKGVFIRPEKLNKTSVFTHPAFIAFASAGALIAYASAGFVALLFTSSVLGTSSFGYATVAAVIDEVVQIKAEPAAEPKSQEVVIDEEDKQKQNDAFADGFPEDTSSIKSLTAEEAEELVKVVYDIRKEKGINLNGLIEINPEVAEKLALFKGRWSISLSRLDSLDEDTARGFKKFKGFLSFEGLSSINQQTAKALTECDFAGVYLHLPTIDAASAKELSKLNRRTHLPMTEQNRHIHFKTLYLYLDTISKDVAKELKNIGCKLMLDVKGPIDATTLAYLKSNDRIIVFSESKVL